MDPVARLLVLGTLDDKSSLAKLRGHTDMLRLIHDHMRRMSVYFYWWTDGGAGRALLHGSVDIDAAALQTPFQEFMWPRRPTRREGRLWSQPPPQAGAAKKTKARGAHAPCPDDVPDPLARKAKHEAKKKGKKKAATKKGNQKKESAAVDTDEPEVGGEDDEEEWNTCQLLLIDLGGASAPQQLRTECRKRKGEASSGDWYHIEDARCCVCSARLYNCDGKVDVEDLKIRSQAIEELELKGQSLGEVLSRWRLAVARCCQDFYR